MIKFYYLLLLFSCFSFSQIKKINDFVYKNKTIDNCESCIYFKIKNKFYKIDESKKILENDKIIYESETNYLINFSVYKKKYLVITYYDIADSKSALGFEYRGIIKLTTINLQNMNIVTNYDCYKLFSLIQIKKINSNGEIVVEKVVKPISNVPN